MKMTISLYELLRVEKTASTAEIRKAFLALAKKVHPDKIKAEDNAQDAGEAFRALRKAYDILVDPERRKLYDEAGVVDDGDALKFQEAYERFRGVKVTEADIERAEESYRSSSDEENDLRAYYEEHQGDVRYVLAYIPASRTEDIHRFVKFWEKKLSAGKLNKRFAKVFKQAKDEIVTTEQLEEDEDLEDNEEEEDGEQDEPDDFIVESEEEEEEDEEDHTPDSDMSFTPGDLVQARWKSGKQWYDAWILSVNKKASTYDVEYVRDKVIEKDVKPEFVRPKPEEKKKASPAKKARTGEDDLAAMIQARQQQRQNDFLTNLEAKYSKKPKGKSS